MADTSVYGGASRFNRREGRGSDSPSVGRNIRDGGRHRHGAGYSIQRLKKAHLSLGIRKKGLTIGTADIGKDGPSRTLSLWQTLIARRRVEARATRLYKGIGQMPNPSQRKTDARSISGRGLSIVFILDLDSGRSY